MTLLKNRPVKTWAPLSFGVLTGAAGGSTANGNSAELHEARLR